MPREVTTAGRRRHVLASVLALLLAGCGATECGPGASCSSTCKAYVTCYEAMGGTKGSLDASYGAMGTCWSTTQEAANSCTRFCKADFQRLIAMFPDAGCKDR